MSYALPVLAWTAAHTAALTFALFLVGLVLAVIYLRSLRRALPAVPHTILPPDIVPRVTEWTVDRDGIVTRSSGDLKNVGYGTGEASSHRMSEYYAEGSDTARRYKEAMERRIPQDWIDISEHRNGGPYIGRTVILPTDDGGLWCRSTDLTALVQPYVERAEAAERASAKAASRVDGLMQFASEDAAALYHANSPSNS